MLALLELIAVLGVCVALAYFVGLKIYLGVGILVAALIFALFMLSGLRGDELAGHGPSKIPDASVADHALGLLLSILIAGGLGAIWPAIPIIVLIGRRRENAFEAAADRARSANAARDHADTSPDHGSPGADTSRHL